jgi:hypothetical protein
MQLSSIFFTEFSCVYFLSLFYFSFIFLFLFPFLSIYNLLVWLSSLHKLFSPPGKITEESAEKMIGERKSMRFSELIEIKTKEFFSKLNELWNRIRKIRQ